MNPIENEELKREYLSWQQRRLQEALSRFNRAHPDQPVGLFSNLFTFHWLQQEIHPNYRIEVIKRVGLDQSEALTTLLLQEADESQYIQGLLSHWLQEADEKQPQYQQVQQWMARYDDQLPDAADAILTAWEKLAIFRKSRIESVRRIQAGQKQTVSEVGGETDRQRLTLVDKLPNRFTRPSPFEKIGLIPQIACPESCRHCMFVWRPPLKDSPDSALLLQRINKEANNVLFTGGDLSQSLSELYRAIREMDNIQIFAILLNGSSATSPEEATTLFEAIRHALANRPAAFMPAQVTLQISFDEYHQEITSNSKGQLKERIPVACIANLVAQSVHYPEIQLVLLHKQNRLNFSKNLFQVGVFARLSRALSQRGVGVASINWHTSPRAKSDPLNPARKGGVIRDALFTLEGFPNRPIHMMSSTIDAYGRAALLDPSEYINEKDYLQQILSDGPPSQERFDIDPMVWYDGSVTLFSASHFWIGDLFEEGDKVFQRYQKDPLLNALERFDATLLDLFSEKDSSLETLINRSTGPHHLFHQLTESAAMRLHLTKRLADLG
ncbi:MAG: hypothetical protein HQL72_12460 [Magnetococcales bacterium]|nr:hypothetical protein [Magnetococcales bacterium]